MKPPHVLVALSLFAAVQLTPTAFAAVTPGGTFADKAIITEAGGGEQLTRATAGTALGPVLVHDFDTIVGGAVDPTYEIVSPTNVALSSGRHLVIYSTRFDVNGGTNRNEIQTNITLAGTALAAGRSQGFTRRLGGADETVMAGGAIINVAADDDVLTLESRRSDTNTSAAALATREPNATSAQLLKLDDSWDYLSLERGANQAGAVGTGGADVTYDTNNSAGTLGTAFSFTATSGDITLNEAGLYLIFANTQLEKAAGDNTRTNYFQSITLDGATVPGSTTTTYLRGNANGENAQTGVAAIGMIVSATAGQVLNINVAMESGGTASTIQGGGTALTMVKLPPTAKYIEVTDSTNQNVVNTAAAAVGFNTQNSATNGDFTHSGGSTVTVTDAGDYLFFNSLFTQSDATNDNHDRVIPLTGWQIDGTGGPINRGLGSAYNRDNVGNRTSGSWSATLLELGAGGTVEMTSQNLGTASAAFPNTPAMQGLSIASLVVNNDPAVSTNVALTVLPGTTGNVIANTSLDTFDNDTPATGLTYTLDSVPALGTLLNNGGAISMGGTFTQDDIDMGLITFDAGGVEGAGGFDFTVSDGTASDSGTFVINVQFPTVTVTITPDGDVVEGGTTDFTVTADAAPVGSDITVNLIYSGSAADGSDYTSVASVVILDGTTSAVANINTSADGLFEGAESVIATLGTMSGATVNPVAGTPSSATFLITDGANSAPTATNIAQVIAGAGTLPIGDIVVSDPDAGYSSAVTGAGTPLFNTNGIANTTTFTDGRAADDSSFAVDAGGPALNAGAGMSLDIDFTPTAADLTGVVDVWEIGGSSNGSALLLIDGVAHFISKAGGTPANAPTNDNTVPGAFNDVSWVGDNTILVPLDGATVLTAGNPASVALVFDIVGGTLKSSVNGSAEATATLLTQDNTNWRGDHTVNTGTGAGSGTGASSTPGGVALQSTLKNMANGFGGTSSVRFWNNATGTATGTAGTLDQVTATLTISGWTSAANGTITATSGNGETFVGGVWTITGDSATVSAALAAAEFVTGGSTADPTVVSVSIDDGDEDGGGALAGTIVVTAVAPDPIYVDDDFSGSVGDPIADADGGAPTSPATFGLSAFATLTEALGAVTPTGTIIINDGDYNTESVVLADTVTLQLTDTAGPVQVGHLQAGFGTAIDLSNNTLELGGANESTGGIAGVISGAGNLNKVGTGRTVIWAPATYTGTTTISDGFLRIGANLPLDASLQSELSGDGPVVVNDPGRIEYVVAVDLSINQTGPISGTGSLATFNDGTLIFDGAGANTFSGGMDLGDGGLCNFDGVDQGTKNGFVVVNHGGHLGTGLVRSRGSQLQAGTPGLVIPNDINIDAGGFRTGGTIGFELGGTLAPINNALRGYGNYGLEGLDLIVSGSISMTAAAHQVSFEGSNGKDNGSWLITGSVTGISNLIVQNTFDGGVVTLAGTNDYTGTTTVQTGTTAVLNGSHTGGGNYTVQASATLEGTGSTTSAVISTGTLSPGGDAVGTLTTGPLTINGALIADLDSLASHDQVVATGAVTLGATSSLVLGAGPGLTAGDLVIISNDDVDAVTGTFAGLPEGTGLDAAALGWIGSISYTAGDANDVGIEFDAFTIIGQWRMDNYGDAANAGAGENMMVGANGRSNLENFALGFDSDGTGDAGTLTISGGSITALGGPQIWEDPADGKFYFQYTRRADHAAAGLTLVEEFARTLTGWEIDAASVASTVATGTGDDGVAIEARQVELPGTLPINSGKARQARLQVSIAP